MRILYKLFPFVFLVLLLLLPILVRQKHFVDEASDSADYVLTTGEISGIYNPLGKAMAVMVNNGLERHRINAIDSNGSIQNIKRLNHEAEFAILQGDIALSATKEYVGLPDARDVRGIMVLYKEFLQVYVKKDSGINNISDLKGKNVSVGLRGSSITHNARAVFEALDIDYDTEISKRYYTLEQSLVELENDRIDAAFFFGGRGIYEVEKVNKRCSLKMLSVPDTALLKMIASDNPVIEFEITNRDYDFVNTPVTSIGQVAILACRKDTPDWIVRRFRQTVLSNTEILKFAHPIAGEIKTIDQSLMPIELHTSLQDLTDERLEYFGLSIFLATLVLIMGFVVSLNIISPKSFLRFKHSILNFNRSYVIVLIVMLVLLAVAVFGGAFILYQTESYVAGTLYDSYSNSLKYMTYSVLFGFDSRYMPVSAYGGIIVNILFITYLVIIVMLTVSISAILIKPYSKLNPVTFCLEFDNLKHEKSRNKKSSDVDLSETIETAEYQ